MSTPNIRTHTANFDTNTNVLSYCRIAKDAKKATKAAKKTSAPATKKAQPKQKAAKVSQKAAPRVGGKR